MTMVPTVSDVVTYTHGGSGEWVVTTDGGFAARNPKPDSIKSTKVTEDNIKTIASNLAKQGWNVDWDGKDAFYAALPGASRAHFVTGLWMIEGYDYVTDKTFYRPASLAERQRYDLR